MILTPYGLGGELLEIQELDQIKKYLILRVSELGLTPPGTGPFWKNGIVPALRSGGITSSIFGMEDFLRDLFREDIKLSSIEGFEESPYTVSISGDKLVFTEEAHDIESVVAVQGVIDAGRNYIESTLELPAWVPELGISELLYPIFAWNGSLNEFNDFIGALRTETKQIHPQNCLIFLLELLQQRFGKQLKAGFEIDYKTKMIRVGNSWYDIVKGSEGLEIEYNPQLPDWCNDESDAYTIIKRAVFFEGNTNSTEILQTLFDSLTTRIGCEFDNNDLLGILFDNNDLLGKLFEEIAFKGNFLSDNIVKVEVSSDEGSLRLKVTTKEFLNSEEGFGPYGAERYHDVTFNTNVNYLGIDINSYNLSDTLSSTDREVFFFATPAVMNGMKVNLDDQFTEEQFRLFVEKLCQLHEDEDIPTVVSSFLHTTLVRMKEYYGDDSLKLKNISVLPFGYRYRVFINGRGFQYIGLDGTDVRIASIGV